MKADHYLVFLFVHADLKRARFQLKKQMREEPERVQHYKLIEITAAFNCVS